MHGEELKGGQPGGSSFAPAGSSTVGQAGLRGVPQGFL